MSYVRIVSRLTSHKSCSCRTAESDGAEMILQIDTLANNMFLNILHVTKRSKPGILVIAYDEDDVGWLSKGRAKQAKEGGAEGDNFGEHLVRYDLNKLRR